VLQINNIETYYAESQALFGLSMSVERGQVVTLIGRNGMGKTTTVNSIMGIVPTRCGEIRYNNELITGLPSFKISNKGIGLVPEGRQIFPNLTVRENLIATAANISNSADPWVLDKVLEFFPGLKPRLDNMGSQLSGGEQQMLAIGRALMINPSLLILDEATEGLAPLVREEIWSRLGILKEEGQSILVIDKNIEALIRLADRHYIIEKGGIVWSGSSTQLKDDPSLKTRYLGV
jgi:branched-chain amino acid transport system ATP-binding protein